MFADAFEITSRFTLPLVVCLKLRDGTTTASISSFVVLNVDGWVFTAAHCVENLQNIQATVSNVRNADAELAAIEADTTLTKKQKKAKARLIKVPSDAAARFSPIWGAVGVTPSAAFVDKEADLALVKLEGLNLPPTISFPQFKDPSKGVRPGTSLCRSGYPFHSCEPTYDESNDVFMLPEGSYPIPEFPIEGILTRNVVRDSSTGPVMIETSSPGLLGQSGGPIFDRHGAIWGIQSQTKHYELGFNPKKSQTPPSLYLHAGWGSHPGRILKLATDNGISLTLTGY